MKPTSPHCASVTRGPSSALRFRSLVHGLGLFLAVSLAPLARAALAPPSLQTDGVIVVAVPVPGTFLAYTLNGVDPRGPRDMLGLGAQFTAQPVVAGAGTLLVVRAFDPTGRDSATLWSPAVTAREAVRIDARTAGPLFASRLSNLSALVNAGPGESAPIIGFTVAGTAPHQFLIRAIGPTLAAFGLAGVLPDPEIVLRNHEGFVISRTSGWTADPALPHVCASVGAFPLPDASNDGAVVALLAPGAYTLQITSRSGQTGLALAEVYDVDRVSGFAGSSARATIGPGRRILAGGFVVAGTTPRKMLVRAIGPGLGVSDTPGNPSLTLYAGSTVIAQNDDWDLPATAGSSAAEIAAVSEASGAFKLAPGSKDAAIVITLAPGAYTAQVTTPGADSGVFLLEVYAVP